MPKRPPEQNACLPSLVEHVSRLTAATFDGVFIYDRGIIINATQKAAAMFGRLDLASCPVAELIAEESRPALLQHLRSLESGPCPALGLRQDGSSFPLEVTLQANLTLQGRKFQVLALRDLSHAPPKYRTDRRLNRSRKSEAPAGVEPLTCPECN